MIGEIIISGINPCVLVYSSARELVLNKLSSSDRLKSLVSDRIFFYFPNTFNTLPCISYFEVVNVSNLFGDNNPIGERSIVQVDVWSNSSTNNISNKVCELMYEIDYEMTDKKDIYEDTGMYRKLMQFRKNSITNYI